MDDYMRVTYGSSVYDNKEIDAVTKVLKTSTQMGVNVHNFEEKVAKTFNKKFGVMVNSGSSALLLAVEALEIPIGSEVITPACTFGTTVGAIIKNNLIPVFVDVKEGTYCIDVEKIEEMISSKTKAVCIPNLIGNIAQWDTIRKICDKHNLKVIEDSADTLGAIIGGKSTGFYSDISITSFYGSHVINAAGNGGMLCLNSEKLVNKIKVLRSWGRSSSIYSDSENIDNRFNTKIDDLEYDSKFIFEAIGYNFEPSEIGAAFGLVQLGRLEKNIKKRTHNFQVHQKFFTNYKNYFILPDQTKDTITGWLAYPLVIKEESPFTRKMMQIFFEEHGIQTRVIFTGNIIRQPGFKNITKRIPKEGLPVSNDVMKGGILIGCHHGLSDNMINHIHRTFKKFISNI